MYISKARKSRLKTARGARIPASMCVRPMPPSLCAGRLLPGDLVGMVTLSPHYPGAPEYIDALAQRGIHISLGHSGASPDQIHAAAAAGARLSTHLGNGVATRLPRHPNLIWAQLAENRLPQLSSPMAIVFPRTHLPLCGAPKQCSAPFLFRIS